MYGGMDYATSTFLNDIWVSSDGTTWQNVGTAAWSPRGSHAMVVHDGRLWLFGGGDHAAADRSIDRFRNDVWVTDDGMTWTQVTEAAPWPARDQAAVLVLDDALYLIGGHGLADVWKTVDGREWAQVASDAPWKSRHGAGRLVFDGKLWVFGGWSDQTTNALNDVWFSSDGATWERQAEHAPWAERAPVSVVFDDRIWIYSGKHTGAEDNWGGDLWQMSAFTTQAT
jgi:N-acetylneuraminic acid mutarotase